MSENQIIHSDGNCQMENNVDKVENLVVEPKNFNNYHNSIVINLTVNVTGEASEEEISRIIKAATTSFSIEFKKIMKTNFDGECLGENSESFFLQLYFILYQETFINLVFRHNPESQKSLWYSTKGR